MTWRFHAEGPMIDTITTLPYAFFKKFAGAGPASWTRPPGAKGSLCEGLAGLGRGGSRLHADGLKLSGSYLKGGVVSASTLEQVHEPVGRFRTLS
jgi:hypothetical protein